MVLQKKMWDDLSIVNNKCKSRAFQLVMLQSAWFHSDMTLYRSRVTDSKGAPIFSCFLTALRKPPTAQTIKSEPS